MLTGPLTKWMNQLMLRRSKKTEMYEILGDCFEEEINLEEEVGRGLELTAEELERLRRECES